jgi:MFS family permease
MLPKSAAPTAGDPLYGWVIVLVAAVAMAATLPGRTHGLGLVTKHLLNDFPGLTPQGFGRINLWATLIGATFCLPCGWLLDRLGIRLLTTIVMAAVAVLVLWMANIRDETSLIVAITLTRGFGQSMLSVISITMIGKWFQRGLPAAMGVYSVAMSMLMAVGTGLLSERINTVGWRVGWHELGIALAVATPLCAIFAASRRVPLPSPLAGDGPGPSPLPSPLAGEGPGVRGPDGESSATLWQALASPCFWVFALSISFFGLVTSGISLWQQLILEERGLGPDVFRNTLVVGLLVGLVVNLTAGALAYVIRLQYMLAVAMALLAAAYVLLPLARTAGHAYAFAIVQGIGGGTLTVLFFTVWRRAYGAAHLGLIQGAAQMLTVFASALGPLLVAESNASAGTYNRILFLFAGVSAAFAAVSIFTPVPSAAAGAWGQSSDLALEPKPQESLA